MPTSRLAKVIILLRIKFFNILAHMEELFRVTMESVEKPSILMVRFYHLFFHQCYSLRIWMEKRQK